MIERLCADVYIAIEIRGEEHFFGYFVCASISFTGVAFWQTLQRLLLLCSFRYFDLLLFIWALRTKTRKRSGGAQKPNCFGQSAIPTTVHHFDEWTTASATTRRQSLVT